jgi:hypothetical protein
MSSRTRRHPSVARMNKDLFRKCFTAESGAFGAGFVELPGVFAVDRIPSSQLTAFLARLRDLLARAEARLGRVAIVVQKRCNGHDHESRQAS